MYAGDLSNDGAVLFTGGADRMLRVWDLQAGVEMQCIPSPSCVKFVDWCEFSVRQFRRISAPFRACLFLSSSHLTRAV